MPSLTIEALYIYPVKSLAAVALNTATLTITGLKGDREWMIVDTKGKFVSQRRYPLLATIKASLTDDGLTLTNKDGDSVVVSQSMLTTSVPVSIWKTVCKGYTSPAAIGQWIADTIHSSDALRLVYFDKTTTRDLDEKRFGPGHTYFSDGAPFLLTNSASLQCLNESLDNKNLQQVPMNRFRPNIVVSGIPAFAEHSLKTMKSEHGTTEFALKDHCQRCAVITVDQSSGLRTSGGHPLKDLAAVNAMPENATAPAFGVNSVLAKGLGRTISVGDSFRV